MQLEREELERERKKKRRHMEDESATDGDTTEQEEDAETEPQLGRGKRHRKQTIIYNALIHACRRKNAMTNTYKAVVGIFCLLACYWLY